MTREEQKNKILTYWITVYLDDSDSFPEVL